MELSDLQSAFMANILDDASALPAGWGTRHEAGLSIYRGNYRNAVIEALRDSFTKTREWTGEAPFKQAAINHVIAKPTASWTIDDAGEGFDATCEGFFSNAPEVAELAWLEWVMLAASSAPETQPISLTQFGEITSAFAEEDWLQLRIGLIPDLHMRFVSHDLHAIWTVEAGERPAIDLEEQRGVLVWREDERPIFQMVEPDEIVALQMLQSGKGYGEVCLALAGDDPTPDDAQAAAMRAGGLLGRWVQEGFVLGLNP